MTLKIRTETSWQDIARDVFIVLGIVATSTILILGVRIIEALGVAEVQRQEMESTLGRVGYPRPYPTPKTEPKGEKREWTMTP